MSAVIATPMRGRQADFEYMTGLMQSGGIYTGWMPNVGQSDIYIARNTIANEFMQHKEFNDLIFVDSDIGFTKENLLDLIATPYPYVSGMYPSRNGAREWIFRGLDGKPVPPDDVPASGIIDAKLIPCGFLKINRCVFQNIIDQELVASYGKGTCHQFFFGVVDDDNLLSEDYSFSILAKRAGFQPRVNCGIRLTHDGRRM